MKEHAVRNSALALLGLASLLIYALACTSFSPDDSKVLYPTIDPKTGTMGVAVYDRASGKSEVLFLPFGVNVDSLESKAVLFRSQWLPDGRSIVVAWPALNAKGEAEDKGLSFAVLPFNSRGPARVFLVPGLQEGASRLVLPLPVAGTFLFLTGESNSLVRLNLATGEMRRQTGLPEMTLLPSPRGDRLFYLAKADRADGQVDCGTLNPDTFARTPLFQVKSNEFGNDASLFTLSRDGKRFAYFFKSDNKPVCRVLESGKPARTLPLTSGSQDLNLGSAQFSPNGNVLYASFSGPGADQTNAAFGYLEIPVDGAPVRQTTLIGNVGKQGDDLAVYFQLDVSHDGKALAVASTYLALDQPLKAEDCALFLVDLADPRHKVTKVSIPLPPETHSLISK